MSTDSCFFIGQSYTGKPLHCENGVYAVQSHFEHTSTTTEEGGAFSILSLVASAFISGCTFYDNSGSLAGTIYSHSPTTIQDCRASHCQTPKASGSPAPNCKGHFCALEGKVKSSQAFFVTFVRNTVTLCAPKAFHGSDDILSFYNAQKITCNYVNLTGNNAEGGSGSVLQVANDEGTKNQLHEIRNCQMVENNTTNLDEFYLRDNSNTLNLSCLICLNNKLGSSFIETNWKNPYPGHMIYTMCLFYGNRVGKNKALPTFNSALTVNKCYLEKGTTVNKGTGNIFFTDYEAQKDVLLSCFPTGTFSNDFENPYERVLLILLLFGTFYVPLY